MLNGSRAERIATNASPAQSDLVFDIGMNICEDTDFYLRKGFRVVAVEADPVSCSAAEARYPHEIASGQLTILNRAVSLTNEPLQFFVCRTLSAWSTASVQLRDHWIARGAQFDEIETPAITPAALIEQFGTPYYAKIDIEGSDLLFLAGLNTVAAAPKYLSVEVDFYQRKRLIHLLGSLGYRRFALVGQSTIPKQRPRSGGREGRDVDYWLRLGCSGLFGDELPADWMDAGALRRRCEQVVRQYRLAGLLGRLRGAASVARRISKAMLPLAQDWYDVHARRD